MISITIPVLREKEALEHAIPLVIETLSEIALDYEIIIASDGDECVDIIEYLGNTYKQIVHCHSESRRGKGGAISDALRIAKGDIFGFIDVDLSTDLKHIKEAVVLLLSNNEYDIIIGTRVLASSSVKRGVVREIASHAYINYVKLILQISSISDFQCGFKVFRTSVLQHLTEKTVSKGWVWDTEILAWAVHDNYKIVELPVHWEESQSSNMRIVDIMKMAMEVKNIKRRVKCGCK